MSDSQKFKTRDALVGLVATLAIGVASWGWKTDRELRDADADARERLAVVESTQFTDADAIKVFAPGLERIAVELKHLGETIKELKTENREIREAVEDIAGM